jgi:hypothetical protein
MTGILGSLPPGLRGYVAAEQDSRQQTLGQLGMMQGILGIQGALAQQQLLPLKMQQLQMAVQQAKDQREALKNFYGGSQTGGLSMGAPVIPGAPGMGGVPNAPKGVPNFAALIAAGVDPARVKAMMEEYKLSNPDIKWEGGMPMHPRTGQPMPGAMTIPQTNQQGFSTTPRINPLTGQIEIAVTPGSAEAFRTQQRIGEETRAGFDLVTVPDSTGRSVTMTRAQAAQRLGGQSPQPAQPPRAMTSGRPPEEVAAIEALQRAERDGVQMTVNVPRPQIGGGGLGPSSAVLGVAPSEAEKAAQKESAVGAVKRKSELPQAQLQVQSQIDDIDRLSTLANEILKEPALGRSVGLQGAIPNMPGSQAANATALVDSLKAQISGMKLQAMRNASKTGGAVGNVTEKEWPRLESMIVALDKKMSPELFREKLSEVVSVMQQMKQNILGAFNQEYGDVQPQRRKNDPQNDPLGLR